MIAVFPFVIQYFLPRQFGSNSDFPFESHGLKEKVCFQFVLNKQSFVKCCSPNIWKSFRQNGKLLKLINVLRKRVTISQQVIANTGATWIKNKTKFSTMSGNSTKSRNIWWVWKWEIFAKAMYFHYSLAFIFTKNLTATRSNIFSFPINNFQYYTYMIRFPVFSFLVNIW